MKRLLGASFAILVVWGTAGCGQKTTDRAKPVEEHTHAEEAEQAHKEGGVVSLTLEEAEFAGVKVERVRRMAVREIVSVPGVVAPMPEGKALVTSPVAGRVSRLLLSIGENVEKGQPLALIESVELAELAGAISEAERTFTVAKAEVARAESELDLNLGRHRSASRMLSRQRELARAGAFSQPSLQVAEREANEATAALEGARREAIVHNAQLERSERLHRQELVSRIELENARLDVEKDRIAQERATREVEIARAALERERSVSKRGLLNAREIQTAEAEVRVARLEAQKSSIDVRAAKAAEEGARKAVSEARAAYAALKGTGNQAQGSRLTIVAPISGTIVHREVSTGQAVASTTELFEIDDLQVVGVVAQVSSADAAKVHRGTEISIMTDAAPGRRLSGTVTAIGGRVDAKTRTVPVFCRVRQSGGTLRPETFVQVELGVGPGKIAPVVPSSALYEEEGKSYVYLERSVGEYVRQAVLPGTRTGAGGGDPQRPWRRGADRDGRAFHPAESIPEKRVEGARALMLDRLLSVALDRRYVVLAVTLALVVWGSLAWGRLNLDAVPDITTNQVQINTQTGGLAPEEVERLVTLPVETALGGLPGLEGTRSLSQYGLSQVTATFRDEVDVYFARQLVDERLGRITLSPGVEKPQMGPVSTGLGDVYMFSVESPKRSPMELRAIVDYQIAPQMRSVPGVAEINVADGSVKQFRVVVDPLRVAARGLSIADVLRSLQENNSNVGGGAFERGGERILVRSIGIAKGIEDVERIPVATENGTPILVRDVASVDVGTPMLTGLSTKDGKEAIIAIGMMLRGANGHTVAQALDARLSEIRTQLPPDVRITTVYNRAHLVDKAVGTVAKSLVEGGVLVVVVLLILLGNLRGALVVAAAIPLSMLFAVSLMERFGLSGNLMSLGAIDFGLIVDGAVVMMENAVRRLAERRALIGRTLTRTEVRETVGAASREVAKPTAFAVSIIAVVYLPLLALEGTEGEMFKPMAFTVMFALLGALLLTLTLIPALASMVLSGDTKEGHNPLMTVLERAYRNILAGAMRHGFAVLGGATCVLIGAGMLLGRLGSEFIPTLDEGDLVVQPIRLRTVDAANTVRLVTAAERKILEVPEVLTVFSRSGTPEVASDPMPLSLTDTFVMLKEKGSWRKGVTKDRIREELQSKLEAVPGQGYNFSQPIQMRFAELVSGVKADLGIKVFGEDLDILKAKAEEIATVVRKIPGAADVEVEQVEAIPVLSIEIDRNAIARYGVSVAEVQRLAGAALGGEPVGQIVEGDRRFDLTLRLPDTMRSSPEAIADLPVLIPSGGTVPLSTLAKVAMTTSPAQISRESGKRRVVVQSNVRSTDLGTFVDRVKAAVRRDVDLPEGTYVTYGGQFENLQNRHMAKRRVSVRSWTLCTTG